MLHKMVEMRCAPAGEMHCVRGPKAMESLARHEMAISDSKHSSFRDERGKTCHSNNN